MPIHRGPRLDDLISRLAYRAAPIQAAHYKTWPDKADYIIVTAANPVGAWVEFISAAAAPTTPFTVMIHAQYTASNPVTYEVGVGPAGSEVAVASAGITLGNPGTRDVYANPMPMPIIPGGSRVSLRVLSVSGTPPCYSKVISALLPPRLDAFNTLLLALKLRTTTANVLSALCTPAGIAAISSATPWTYGAYAQMYAAAAEPAPTILTAFSWMSDCVTSVQEVVSQFAVATGGAGAEVDFLTLPFYTNLTNNPSHRIELPVPLLLPGGTRLSMRHATDRSTTQNMDYPLFTVVKSAIMP